MQLCSLQPQPGNLQRGKEAHISKTLTDVPPRGTHEMEWVRTWRRIVEKKDCGMSGIAYQIQSTWPVTGVSWQMADGARVKKPSSP